MTLTEAIDKLLEMVRAAQVTALGARDDAELVRTRATEAWLCEQRDTAVEAEPVYLAANDALLGVVKGWAGPDDPRGQF